MSNVRLLVAEDDPVFRRVIMFTLQQSGFEVEAVSDGESAWNEVEQRKYDFLITDHQMPRCSGIELIERIRSSKQHCDLPIILCTAKGLELDSENLRHRYCIADVLHKPFSPRVLADRVGVLLESNEEVQCAAH